MSGLSSKSYWANIQPAPEFVFMFLPEESFYSMALQRDAHLIEDRVKQRVIIATPLTLIALLLTVEFGWRQETSSKNTEEIRKLGSDIYERLCTMGKHFADLGSSLGKAVDCYGLTLGSLETRVFVTARRFKDLGVAVGDENILPVECREAPRQVQAPEMLESISS
jgi:DNA recombination protein RmuC